MVSKIILLYNFFFCIFSAKLLTCYSEDHIKVHFSDYACIDVVPLKHLRELLNEFKLLPEQAIQAKLYGKSTIFFLIFADCDLGLENELQLT